MKGIRLADGSTIWQDGSRTYPGAGKKADPPTTWPYPPPGGGTPVEIVTETIQQHPGVAVGEPNPTAPTPRPSSGTPQQANEPPSAPTTVSIPEIAPLPATVSEADAWDRWQKLVSGWVCLLGWGGGDLDKLTIALGANLPLFTTNKGAKTAIGWWRDVQAAGLDKAVSAADLGKGLGVDANDVRGLVAQFNSTAALARTKGYTGCPPPAPPAPPPPGAPPEGGTISDARAGISRFWGGLSPRGKLATAAVAVLGGVLVLRGVSK